MLKAVLGASTLALTLFSGASQAQTQPIKEIVLVHGAFVNGAGWKPVYDILTKDGYQVSIAEHPLTSFSADVTAVKRTIDALPGPVLLVGHSYGGAIITDAGNDPKVKGLVYIAAHALDKGETEKANGKRFPNSARPLRKSADGYLTIAPANYPADFAADLPTAQASFEADAQEWTNASVFAAVAGEPAWRHKPTWYAVAKMDKIINPDLERMYAKRAHAHTIEIAGASHSVYESHPQQVAALIEEAARQALNDKAMD